MHPQWQAIATRLERERKAMAKPAALHRDKAIVMAANATSLDLTVLDKDTTTGIVRLGVFKMPAIPKDIMPPPKGVCSMSLMTPSVCGGLLPIHPAAPLTAPPPHAFALYFAFSSLATSCDVSMLNCDFLPACLTAISFPCRAIARS
jgi:hypothetical protein